MITEPFSLERPKALPVACAAIGLLLSSGCVPTGAGGGLLPSDQTQLGGVTNTVQTAAPSLRRCAAPIGTVALVEPADEVLVSLGTYGLPSPVPILKLLMARSQCFQVVDRGAASEALQRERALAAQGELEEGSNMGGGQMVAADYLITPNLLFQDRNAGGSNIGAALGAFLPGGFGALAGGISTQNLEAQVLLTLTNVRTGVQEAVSEGSARKADIGFDFGALVGVGRVGAGGGSGSYTSTDIGKIVMAAFVDGLNKMVGQIGGA